MQRILLCLLMLTLAGCAESDGSGNPGETLPTDPGHNPSQPGNGFAPQTGHQEASDARISLAGDLYVVDCDAMFCIDAVATHESGDAYVSNICVSPWSESMQQRGTEVHKSEPYAVCAAWGVRALEPGEELHANFTWDGRLWDDDAQEYRDAPQGSYTWLVHFGYHENADGGSPQRLTIEFPVIIGAT